MNTRYIVIPIVILALLAAFSAPVSAVTGGCPSETKYSETIHGGIYYVAQAPPSAVFTDVPDGIKLARLYTGDWGGSPGSCVDYSLTINDFTTETYHACDPDSYPERCSVINTSECRDYVTGCGVHFIAYNATPHIVPGNNTISTTGYGYVLGLLVVYEDPSMPEITYWINEGSPLMISGSGCDPDSDEIFIYFNGTTGSTNAMKYWTLGFPSNAEVNPDLNENYIGAPDYLSYLYRWDNILTSYLNPSSNLFYYYHPGAGYERVHSAVLMLEQGEPAPDTEPPYTTGHDPAKGATDVPPDTNVVVHVKESGTGVNNTTIVMMVEGTKVEPTITGDKYDYTLTYDPPTDFDYGQVVDVTVDASDLNETPNVMTTDSYSFTIMELEPSTSFFISGWVNNSAGEPVNNPVVNITNTNTSEVFAAETIATSNYYQVLTSSENVSAGDVLHFYACDNDNVTELDHTVTEVEMNNGGFEQNIIVLFPYKDLIVTRIDAYHNETYYPEERYPPYFNLSNEIDVTVENAGTEAANSSHVSLYIDGELYGKQSIPALDAGSNATVQFKWTPEGYDCEDGGNSTNYTLKAIADCDGEIEELYEGNNETTVQETAYWAGYSTDEVLIQVFNGTIKGGLNFTTGDGVYTGLYSPGASTDIHYDITLPDGASVELARLNVYYTWSYTDSATGKTGVYASMEVNITNVTSGETHTLSTDAKYNDRPCDSPAIIYDYPYGNYVYDLTPYVNGSGSYNVTVKNNGTTGHSFAIDPPGMVILYNDSTKPEYDYWILEGADLLQGGRRGGSGNLALSECINNATFEGTIDLGKMESATLALATPWGGNPTAERHSYLYFNGNELGKDVYHGYGETYSKTLNGMSMHIGSTNAQMGVNLTDVKSCLEASDNVVGQGDDGDSMMVANVFLLVERVEKKDDVANADIEVKGTVTGSYVDTHVSDNVYEAITEEESKGNPAKRYSYLEHKWTIDVTGGSKTSVTFYLEAYRTRAGTTDSDDFEFEYWDESLGKYITMVTVNSSDETDYTYELPKDTSGNVTIRVIDTDRITGHKDLDMIYIDHIFIRSVFGAPDTTAPVITNVTNTTPTHNSVTITWDTDEPADSLVKYGTVSGSYTMSKSDATSVTSHSIELTELESNTTYYYVVNSTDPSGNSNESVEYSFTTAEAPTDQMHVASIEMSLSNRTAGKNIFTHATAVVTIVNNVTGAPVEGATVEGNWSNATSDSDSGITDSTGQVSLDSDEVKNAPSGTTFTFTVDNVVKDGWTWDMEEKSGSITYYK